MKLIDIKSIVSVFQVSDIEKSLLWYKKWLGEPDVVPMEGVAEYELNKETWLQLSYEGNEKIEKSAIIIGIEDIKSCILLKKTFNRDKNSIYKKGGKQL